MGNRLKTSLDVTYEDFLKGVFGGRSKPEWRALTTLFSEIVEGESTLVSDLSKPLRENASLAEAKRAQERVSGWLANYDFVTGTGGWLLKNIPESGLEGKTFAVDFSDISNSATDCRSTRPFRPFRSSTRTCTSTRATAG